VRGSSEHARSSGSRYEPSRRWRAQGGGEDRRHGPNSTPHNKLTQAEDESFVEETLERDHNGHIEARLEEERPHLRPLPQRPVPIYTREEPKVLEHGEGPKSDLLGPLAADRVPGRDPALPDEGRGPLPGLARRDLPASARGQDPPDRPWSAGGLASTAAASRSSRRSAAAACRRCVRSRPVSAAARPASKCSTRWAGSRRSAAWRRSSMNSRRRSDCSSESGEQTCPEDLGDETTFNARPRPLLPAYEVRPTARDQQPRKPTTATTP